MGVRPVITFLSDYGLADDFVGVCHGVIAAICPEARVIDLTHGVPRARRPRRRADPARRAAVPAGRACTWPSSTRRWAASAARWRCAPRTAALLVGPRQRPAVARRRARRRRGRGGRHRALAVCASSRCRPRSTGATSSPRWPRGWRAARALSEAGEPSTRPGWCALELPAPRVEDGALVAHARVPRPVRQRPARRGARASSPAWAARSAHVAVSLGGESWPRRLRAHVRRRRRRASCSSTRTPTGGWRVAVNQRQRRGRSGSAVGDELRIAPA